MKINLLWLSSEQHAPDWALGEVVVSRPEPLAVHETILKILQSQGTDAWLFWDAQYPLPSIDIVTELFGQKNDVFHAGLLVGNAGQPEFINYVSPTWMLNRDPDSHVETTSWRLSLRACLIRTKVLRQLGGPLPCFETLDAASLEMGYRYIRNGIFIRHCPNLLCTPKTPGVKVPVADELKFIGICFGKKWLYWAVFRAIVNKKISIRVVFPSLRSASRFSSKKNISPYFRREVESEILSSPPSVSVLIPTVNRYSYLRTVLSQLRDQTVKPHEILIIDQTPLNSRDRQLKTEFSDLPIRWFDLEKAGQCSSRNFGILESSGEYILFIDDDDEIKPDLIESHIRSLNRHLSLVSSGSALEPGMVEPDSALLFPRISDVFPTNNTLIKKEILLKSGLFDLAYDLGQRADHDLGMRIYLSGQKMVLDPQISLFHHHAPQGGLREHKARVITRTASRKSLIHRVLPSPSDIYLAKRYFSDHQVREMLWISVFETFTLDGPMWKKVIKGVISLLALPFTMNKLQQNINQAELLLQEYPQIPTLSK